MRRSPASRVVNYTLRVQHRCDEGTVSVAESEGYDLGTITSTSPFVGSYEPRASE